MKESPGRWYGSIGPVCGSWRPGRPQHKVLCLEFTMTTTSARFFIPATSTSGPTGCWAGFFHWVIAVSIWNPIGADN